jgi:hypothetical protein
MNHGEMDAMNTTSDLNDDSVTLLEWLDAVARGQTPLPTPSIIVKNQRCLHVVRVIVTWTFTLATLLILAIGTLYSGVLIASWYYLGPVIGFYIWLITMGLVAALGTLAFICGGRFLMSVVYIIASLVVNFCYLFAQFGLASLAPVLMIPPAVLLNGAHAYVLWRFVLSPPMGEGPVDAERRD